MGAALRPNLVSAARLRGARTRTFFGAAGTLPSIVRRTEYPGLRADHTGPVLSRSAPTDDQAVKTATDPNDTKEFAATQTVRQFTKRPKYWRISSSKRRQRLP